jgi:hypothetical protein
MIGRRRDVRLHEMEPGDYGFAVYGPKDTGMWCCRAPNGYGGNLSGHEITEHEDSTITVSPSILITRAVGDEWHGFLERGVWRAV